MKDNEMKKLLEMPDFILSRRFNNSLKEMVDRYPDGVPDHIIASALAMTEQDVKDRYSSIIQTFRKKMNVDV